MATTYKLINGGVVRSDGCTMCDSLPEMSKHWQEYQDWLKAGNKPLPADKPVIVPPPRDLARELDALKADHTSLKTEVAALTSVAK